MRHGHWRHLIADRAWTIGAVGVAVALLVLTVVSLPVLTGELPADDSTTAAEPRAEGGAEDSTDPPSATGSDTPPDSPGAPETTDPGASTSTDEPTSADAEPTGGDHPTGGEYPTGSGTTGDIRDAENQTECEAAGGAWVCYCDAEPRYFTCEPRPWAP